MASTDKSLTHIKQENSSPEDFEKIRVVTAASLFDGHDASINMIRRLLQQNGAEVIHFATGMIVGYPPCPYINYFKRFIEANYGLRVIIGTHPIPEKYYLIHSKLNTWDTKEWSDLIKPTLKEKKVRLAYD